MLPSETVPVHKITVLGSQLGSTAGDRDRETVRFKVLLAPASIMAPQGSSPHRVAKCAVIWSCLPSLSLAIVPVASGLVNVTVDDQFGDPTTGIFPEYLPDNGTWHVGSPTEDCPACHIQPSTLDLSQIYNQTWHDGTYYPPGTPITITIQFTGSAVYVFNILPNSIPNITDTYTNISFSIDGEEATVFTHTPSLSSVILYNQLVYHNATLPHSPHTLIMAAAGTSSLILFDYLLYTTLSNDTVDTEPTTILTSTHRPSSLSTSTSMPTSTTTPSGSSQSPSSNTPSGAVVGAVVAAIALLLSVAIGAFLFRRSLRTRSTPAQMQQGHAKTHTVHRSGGEDEHRGAGGSESTQASTAAIIPQGPEMSVRSVDGASAATTHNVPGPGTHRHPSLTLVDTGSTSTATWTAHNVDLVRRLETFHFQHSRSVPSIEPPADPSRLGVNDRDVGVEMVIRELAAEIAALRAQFAEEPLPAYAE